MQLNRRNTYSQLSAHKREGLLLSRRMQTDSTIFNLLQDLTIGTPTQSTSSCYSGDFSKQVVLIIREPPVLPHKATSHQVQPTQPQDNLNKGKQVYNPLIILKQRVHIRCVYSASCNLKYSFNQSSACAQILWVNLIVFLMRTTSAAANPSPTITTGSAFQLHHSRRY